MAEETPGPYLVTAQCSCDDPKPLVICYDCSVTEFAKAVAAGVASANERNAAQWARVKDRIKSISHGWFSDISVGLDKALRIIDEERGKP